MSTTAPLTRNLERSVPMLGSWKSEQTVSPWDHESSDSDYRGTEDGPSKKEGNTDDRYSAVKERVSARLRENAFPSGEKIGERLKDLIMNQRKGLKNMYGETEEELNNSLEAPITRGEEMARKLITEMGCSREIAIDLTVLALYDVAILIRMFRASVHCLRRFFAYALMNG